MISLQLSEKLIQNQPLTTKIIQKLLEAAKYHSKPSSFQELPLSMIVKIKNRNKTKSLWQSTGAPILRLKMNRLSEEIKRDIKKHKICT